MKKKILGTDEGSSCLDPGENGIRPPDYGSSVTEIPDTETAPKKHNADEGSKSIRDRLTALETRRVKCKMSFQVPKNT